MTTTTQEPVVKHVPEDFVVTEIHADGVQPAGPYRLYELRKRGMTTLAAVQAVAEALRVPSSSVGHAGMKDEDAVTSQRLTVRVGKQTVTDVRSTVVSGRHAWAELRPLGHAEQPLRPGALLGNAFSIAVRNLAKVDADGLVAHATRQDLLFVNYYDTQRFGVPGGARTTHLVGAALAEGRHAEALDVLRESGTPEGEAAQSHSGEPKMFFAGLDGRIVAFYRSAAESALWNAEVARSAHDAVPTLRDGLSYPLPRSNEAAWAWGGGGLTRAHLRWTSRDGELQSEVVHRPQVVQTRVRASSAVPDSHFHGRWMVRVSFMLPSGCYATMALHHLTTYAGILSR